MLDCGNEFINRTTNTAISATAEKTTFFILGLRFIARYYHLKVKLLLIIAPDMIVGKGLTQFAVHSAKQ